MKALAIIAAAIALALAILVFCVGGLMRPSVTSDQRWGSGA